jgi:hypothetical protein
MPLRDNIDTNNLNEDYLSFCFLKRLPRQVIVVFLLHLVAGHFWLTIDWLLCPNNFSSTRLLAEPLSSSI